MNQGKNLSSRKQYENETSVHEWSSKDHRKFPPAELPRTAVWLPKQSFLSGSYNQQGILAKAMSFCFVCGNGTSEDNMVHLYSRSHGQKTNMPFFPFLEYHDPAPGADAMKDDCSILACSVCSALLSQQWQSFERARMPINKRLYWLKRPSGCEIRQPVSQIELEEILNEHSRDDYEEQVDGDSAEEETESPKKMRMSAPNVYTKEKARNSTEEKPALTKTPSFVCYCCGKKNAASGSVYPIHCRPSFEQMRAGAPFYPSVLKQSGAAGSSVLNDSITCVCLACLPKYKKEWHFEQQRVIKEDVTKPGVPRVTLPETVPCFLCSGDVNTKYNDGIVYTTSLTGKKNIFFKKLDSKKPREGSVHISWGFTYLCVPCHKSVQAQEMGPCQKDADNSCSKC